MANIDHDRKRITAVLLFYGPPGAGKTTSLYALARHLPPGTHGKVAPLQQGDERLLRLDYRPHDHEMVYGYQLSFRLVTSPEQMDVDLVRPVLAAADAVMFVADSASNSLNANLSAMEQLDRMALSCGRRLDDLPIVFMYNKRDLRDALEIRLLEKRLNRFGSNYLAASAIRGQGVLEALQRLTATVAVQLRTELAGAPGVTESTSSTQAHGTSYDQARAMQEQGQDMDDVTAVSVERGAAGVASWQGQNEGSDDHTEVNPSGVGWEIDAAPPAAPPSPPRQSRTRPAPQQQYGQPHQPEPFDDRGGRPGFGSRPESGTDSFRSVSQRRAPRQQQRQAPPPNPVYADQSWRTPEAFADIASDDHTMPYMDFEQEVGELPQAGEVSPVQGRPQDRRSGPASATSLRRPPSAGRGPEYRAPQSAPQRGRHATDGRSAPGSHPSARRVDSSRITGSMRNVGNQASGHGYADSSIRNVPSSGSIRNVPSSGSIRNVPSSASIRNVAGHVPHAHQGQPRAHQGQPRAHQGQPHAHQGQAPPPQPQSTPRQPQGNQGGQSSFTKTMAINALGREAEPWEVGIEHSGHQVQLMAPDLSGYVVSRIGTPKAASRRTVRIPVRATHMDTLVPQDFLLDIEFRGGAGTRPAISARKNVPEDDSKTVPRSWFILAVGALVVGAIIFMIAQ